MDIRIINIQPTSRTRSHLFPVTLTYLFTENYDGALCAITLTANFLFLHSFNVITSQNSAAPAVISSPVTQTENTNLFVHISNTEFLLWLQYRQLKIRARFSYHLLFLLRQQLSSPFLSLIENSGKK